jgi:DNA-binding CsgD family transcriptional regulator
VRLTPTQRDVLRCILQRLTPKELAGKLQIEISTARTHIRNIHAATDTHTMADLAFWAVEHRDCCIGEFD